MSVYKNNRSASVTDEETESGAGGGPIREGVERTGADAESTDGPECKWDMPES